MIENIKELIEMSMLNFPELRIQTYYEVYMLESIKASFLNHTNNNTHLSDRISQLDNMKPIHYGKNYYTGYYFCINGNNRYDRDAVKEIEAKLLVFLSDNEYNLSVKIIPEKRPFWLNKSGFEFVVYLFDFNNKYKTVIQKGVPVL